MVSDNLKRRFALFLTLLAILSIPVLIFTFSLVVMLELSLLLNFEMGDMAEVISLTILNGTLLYLLIKLIRWIRS